MKKEFHTKKNWINDPNGLTFFHNEFHIYFQYNPFGNEWGNMHWGHATTKDFITYIEHEPALAPDKNYDKDGCFSGSSVIVNDELYVYYTSVTEGKQNQSVAISKDGYNFVKYENNPILKFDEETRDPYVFCYENELHMILGTKGKILLYKAKSMFEFELVSTLFEIDDFPECPNLFLVGNNYYLMYSSIKDRKCHVLSGEFNGKTFKKIEEENIDLPDYFYAGLTFYHKGDTILMGWVHTPDYKSDKEYNGKLTVPYLLYVENGKLRKKEY